MAHIEKWKGNRWRARWRNPDGRTQAKVFTRKADADKWLTHIEHSKLIGAYVDPKRGKETFGAYATRWLDQQVHLRATTRELMERHLKKHLLPTLGSRPIASIRSSTVQSWIKGLSDHLAPATTEVVYRLFVSVMRAAVADGLIVRAPTEGVKIPKVERPPVVPLRVDQVAAIAAAIGPRYRALVLFAAGTGARQGECFGLQLDRIDFLRRTVRIDQQLVKLQGSAPDFAPPKTKASYRTIPLPQVVVDALAAHLASYPVTPNGLVFTNDRGEPIYRTRFSDTWRAATTAAAVDGTFHGLRHHYASLLIQYGESVKVVQARLGHASPQETLITYSHLWPETEDRTRRAIDALWEGGGSPAGHAHVEEA